MKWQVWCRRAPKAPEIPPYTPPIQREHAPESAIEVEEVDTSAMSRTGIHRAWDRLAGK